MTSWLKRARPVHILLLIILFGLALRVAAAFWLGPNVASEEQKRAADQVSYDALARELLAGEGFSFDQIWYPFIPADTPTAHWSFGYSLFLALIYALVGSNPLLARIVQVLLVGSLTIWLSYRLGKRLHGQVGGLLAAASTALYAYFVYYDATLMTEPLFIVGVLASMEIALAIAAHTGPAYRLWTLLGLVLGLTALLRQTILLWIPFLLLWLYFVAWRNSGRPLVQFTFSWLSRPALALVICGVLILPFTIRNWLVFHDFMLLNSNSGYALFAANHPHHGIRFDQDYVAPLPEVYFTNQYTEVEKNDMLTRAGLQFVLSDPQRYILLTLNRISVFFNFWFSSESSLSSNLLRVLSFGLFLPFFLYGLWLGRRDFNRSSLFYLFALVFTGVHVMTWASIRYRLPIDATLIPFAAGAFLDLWNRVPFFKPQLAH